MFDPVLDFNEGFKVSPIDGRGKPKCDTVHHTAIDYMKIASKPFMMCSRYYLIETSQCIY
jgi:hypothetical protein